jgi:hypothetical protein
MAIELVLFSEQRPTGAGGVFDMPVVGERKFKVVDGG